MFKVLSVLACAHLISSACLPDGTLRGLNFANLKTTTAAADTTTVYSICPIAYSAGKPCVEPTEVTTVINTLSSDLWDKFNGQGATAVSFFESLKSKVTNLVSTSSSNSSYISNLQDQVKANKDACYRSFAYINAGAQCVISSGRATDFVADNGSTVNLNVLPQPIFTQMMNCINHIELACFVGYGYSITSNYTQKITSPVTVSITNDTCIALKAAWASTNSTRNSTIASILIKDIINLGNSPKIVVSQSSFDKFLSLFSRRLEQTPARQMQSTKTVILVESSTGYDVVNEGSNSKVTLKSAQIFFSAILAILTLINLI